jgi:AcrR family transcriptional regulator
MQATDGTPAQSADSPPQAGDTPTSAAPAASSPPPAQSAGSSSSLRSASSPPPAQSAGSSSSLRSASSPPRGLRERKKIKTRQAIRREAFRLIDENGYAATTVEQIAEAAEVSPSTFFRYFPSKESVLLADDMDPAILDALLAQPPDLSPSQAVRRAYETAMANMSKDQREFEDTRQRLMFSIPELKAAMYDEYHRTVTTFAEAMARRTGRDAGDFELRVFAGALTGAMMAVYNPGPGAADTVARALDFVDAGMPLT